MSLPYITPLRPIGTEFKVMTTDDSRSMEIVYKVSEHIEYYSEYGYPYMGEKLEVVSIKHLEAPKWIPLGAV